MKKILLGLSGMLYITVSCAGQWQKINFVPGTKSYRIYETSSYYMQDNEESYRFENNFRLLQPLDATVTYGRYPDSGFFDGGYRHSDIHFLVAGIIPQQSCEIIWAATKGSATSVTDYFPNGKGWHLSEIRTDKRAGADGGLDEYAMATNCPFITFEPANWYEFNVKFN